MKLLPKILSFNFVHYFLKKKVKASTLVEVLVAIAVCMIVFTLAMTILLKADQESNSLLKLKAGLAYPELVEQLDESIEIGTDTLYLNGLVIARTVEPVDSLTDVMAVTFHAYDNNKIPLSVKRVLIEISQSENE